MILNFSKGEMRKIMSKKQIKNQDDSMPKDESIRDVENEKRIVFEIFESPDGSAPYTIYIPSSEELTKVTVDVYTRFDADSINTRQMRSMTVEFNSHMRSDNGSVSLRNNSWQTVSEKRRTYE